MNKVWVYVKRYKLRISFGLMIKIVGTLMDLAIPYVLAHIIDNLLPTKDIKKTIMFGALMVVFSLIGLIFNIIANRMASWVAKNITRDLRHDLFAKAQNLSSAQMDQVTMPSLISRLSSDTYNVHQMVGMMQRMGIRAPILLIGGIIVTFTLDPILTLVLLATLPLIVISTIVISKIGIPIFTNIQKSIDDMIRTIRENITGIRVIKALSKGDYEKKRFAKVNQEVIKYELKSGYTMGILNPIISILLNIGLVGVIVVGAYRVNDGFTGVGKVISFTTYFIIILNAMLSITRIFIIYSRSAASAARISYIMDLPIELIKENDTQTINRQYHIEFSKVDFSYNKHENNLSNISFTVLPGESLGIIGATGSGKSTIIQLLMRFYDCDQGVIRINGRNVKEYDPKELKEMFGVVFQNDNIFSDTIKENITFGRQLEEKDIAKAIRVSQAEEFIKNQVNGLETIMSPKGTNISGGQKQRLLIARALAGRPEILILDDASSALDYKTDAALRQGITAEYGKLTSIIITQRISSIINCNQIIVIDEGKMIGLGSHQELLSTVEIYQEIYYSQMGGVVNE